MMVGGWTIGELLFWRMAFYERPYRRKIRENRERPRIWEWRVLERWETGGRGSAGVRGSQHEHEMVFTPGLDLEG
jgi:hypothetical protein